MPYIGTTPTKVVSRQSANVFRYTATAGQSVFTGADLDNNVLACNPADMIVHMNGLRLESTDYTATSTSVTLTAAATAGDEVTVTSFVTFEVADTYTKTAADDRYVNTTGDTMTGTLDVGGVVRNTNGLRIGASNAGTGYGLRIGASGATDPLEIWRDHANGDQMQLSVDYYGRVTMPYQPAFLATSTSGWVDYTVGQTLVFNNSTLNVGGNFNTSTYAFTAPVSGVYHIFANIYLDTSNPRLSMYVNGTQLSGGGDVVPYIDTVQTSMGTMSHNIYLNSSDYVTIGARSGYAARAYMGHSSFGGYLIG